VNKTIIIVIGALVMVAGLAIYAILPSNPDGTGDQEPMIIVTDPQILSAPVASNILVGQSTTESILTGEFSVPGDLQFTGIEFTSFWPGTAECDWEFTPDDLTRYNKLAGTVIVSIFEYKLIFVENGGFEIEDIYFNDTYTLTKRPITAKNEYRFDDWSTTNSTKNFITYPFTVSGVTELYAQYTFHTAEKLEYRVIHDSNGPTDKMSVRALWGSNGIVEEPPGLRPFDPPVPGSISGEVVIADMYNGLPVTWVANFRQTNITNIVFPNFVEEIGTFFQCRSLGPELIIPNTVTRIADNAFDNC